MEAYIALVLSLLLKNVGVSESPHINTIVEAAVAVSVEKATKAFPEKKLLAAILTGVEFESGFTVAVHSGEVRGKAGEICVMQIHPTNSFWKKAAPTFEELAGVDLEATKRCITAGALTLLHSRSYCVARRYYKNADPAMWTLYHYGGRCWLSPHAFARTKRQRQWEAWLRDIKREEL